MYFRPTGAGAGAGAGATTTTGAGAGEDGAGAGAGDGIGEGTGEGCGDVVATGIQCPWMGADPDDQGSLPDFHKYSKRIKIKTTTISSPNIFTF